MQHCIARRCIDFWCYSEDGSAYLLCVTLPKSGLLLLSHSTWTGLLHHFKMIIPYRFWNTLVKIFACICFTKDKQEKFMAFHFCTILHYLLKNLKVNNVTKIWQKIMVFCLFCYITSGNSGNLFVDNWIVLSGFQKGWHTYCWI